MSVGRYAVVTTAPRTSIDETGRQCDFPAGAVMRIILWDGVTDIILPAGTVTRPDDGTPIFTAPVPVVIAPIAAFAAKIVMAQTPSTRNAGKTVLDDVNDLIPSQPLVNQLAWNGASQFDRASPLLNALAAQIGLTQDQLDQMFQAAHEIQV